MNKYFTLYLYRIDDVGGIEDPNFKLRFIESFKFKKWILINKKFCNWYLYKTIKKKYEYSNISYILTNKSIDKVEMPKFIIDNTFVVYIKINY